MPDVLDSSAVLALLYDEPGAPDVESCLDDALISSVNEAEILRVLVRNGMGAKDARSALRRFNLPVAVFDSAQAAEAVELNLLAPSLSLGDCACLALARLKGARRVLTADRLWTGFDFRVNVKLIR